MIQELRIYKLHPGQQPAFLTHASEVGLRIRENNHGTLNGYWTSEFGALNHVYHLWSFESLEHRRETLAQLSGIAAWSRDYLPTARKMIVTQESLILSPVFAPDPPPASPNVYELRRYTAHPGKLAEWLSHFQQAAPARRRMSHLVGLWTTEFGPLNQGIHLWSYKDLNERAVIRARSVQDPDWKEFLGKVPPLLMNMESTVLIPAPFSPLR